MNEDESIFTSRCVVVLKKKNKSRDVIRVRTKHSRVRKKHLHE